MIEITGDCIGDDH